MKKLALLSMLLLVPLGGCDDDSPTEPSDSVPTFTMPLLSSNEPSLPTPSEAPCTGNVRIRLNLTRDSAQVITAATADFLASISACPAGTSIILAHIHRGVAGVNGPVLVDTHLAAGEVNLAGGAGSFTKNGVPISPLSIAQEIIDNPGGFYFNVHSQNNPGGLIRAQLVRAQ